MDFFLVQDVHIKAEHKYKPHYSVWFVAILAIRQMVCFETKMSYPRKAETQGLYDLRYNANQLLPNLLLISI